MTLKEHLVRLEGKIDSIDDKLDGQIERQAVAETDVKWLKAHLKLSLSVAIAIIGSLAGYLFNL